ncbi:EpsG family protein [Vibrio splendidus]|uniref:EpsG family protein n=1 Tax=Vibrio splendidus TaxID=29497 RepID=UPI003D147EB3
MNNLTTPFYMSFFILALISILMDERTRNLYIGILLFIIIIIFGLRVGIGPDYDNYHNMYSSLELGSGSAFEHIIRKTEFGFVALNDFFIWVGLPYQSLVFFLFSSTMILTFISGRKYVRNTAVLLIFVLGMGYLMNALNLYRQSLAISIVLFSMSYLIEGKIKRFATIVVLASSIHYTALLAFSFFFFIKIKQSQLMVFVALILTIFVKVITSIYNLPEIVASIISIPDTYAPYFMPTNENFAGLGLRPIIELLYLVLLIYLFGKQKFPSQVVFFNYLFVVGIGINFSLLTVGVFSRLSMPFYFVGIYAIPALLFSLRKNKLQAILAFLVLSLMFLLYFRTASSENYHPYCMYTSTIEGKICLD